MIWNSSRLSVVAGPRPQLRHRLAAGLAALLLLPMTALGFTAQGAQASSNSQPGQAASAEGQPAKVKLPSITIEAAREKALRLKVDQFVTTVVVQPYDDALFRWNKPICPLVAGLPKNWGEFILERVSKAAIDAHAPLGGKICHPDLYVVATDHPDQLLEQWWARDRMMFNYNHIGIETVEHFIQSRRPIRVWYNTFLSCNERQGSAAAFLGPAAFVPVCTLVNSRIQRTSIGSTITSAIVVIDLRRMKGMTIQQLGDYIALSSLADVRLDAEPGSTPSILQLFGHGTPPQGLTLWDRALLYALYNTSQWTNLEVPELELTMVRRIAP